MLKIKENDLVFLEELEDIKCLFECMGTDQLKPLDLWIFLKLKERENFIKQTCTLKDVENRAGYV